VILRTPAVRARNGGIGKSTLHRRVAAGLHTPPVKLGARASGYPEHEVDAILAARIAGKSDEEIRRLVAELIAARKTLSALPKAA
jgi:prophage regulatory protein